MSYQVRTTKGSVLASGEMAENLWDLLKESTPKDNLITRYELWEIFSDRPPEVKERL